MISSLCLSANAFLCPQIFFRARYRFGHIAGSALCTAGLGILVLTDRAASGCTEAGRDPLLGDALVIMGACVYAVCNIAQVRLWSHALFALVAPIMSGP